MYNARIVNNIFWILSEGQEEVRTTKEDMEDTSREGEQECWLEKVDALIELSKMETGSWRDAVRVG